MEAEGKHANAITDIKHLHATIDKTWHERTSGKPTMSSNKNRVSPGPSETPGEGDHSSRIASTYR